MFKHLRERFRDLSNWQVLGILLGVAVLSALFSAHALGGLDSDWWGNVWQGLVTEMGGAAATFWLINLILEGKKKREEKAEATEEAKERLIRDLGSEVNDVAKHAAEELRHRRWLLDGSLHDKSFIGARLEDAPLKLASLEGANFLVADLQRAVLHGANLQKAVLTQAKLQGSWLTFVDLTEATLLSADLQKADLRYGVLKKANLDSADLQGADLEHANLEGAMLENANLIGANLLDTNLKGTNLKDAEFDEMTMLPDGNNWNHSIDLSRFTNPSHRHYWRSDSPGSIAYRGRSEK